MLFDYYRADGRKWIKEVAKSSPLGAIQRRVTRWAPMTGVPPAELTRYILCGTAPRLRGVSLMVSQVGNGLPPPNDPHIRRKEVTIRLDTRDITQAQFLEIFKRLRRWLGLDRVRAMTTEDRQLLAAAKKAGDRTDFDIDRQHNAAIHKKLPKAFRESIDPQVLGRRYRRLKERLK